MTIMFRQFLVYLICHWLSVTKVLKTLFYKCFGSFLCQYAIVSYTVCILKEFICSVQDYERWNDQHVSAVIVSIGDIFTYAICIFWNFVQVYEGCNDQHVSAVLVSIQLIWSQCSPTHPIIGFLPEWNFHDNIFFLRLNCGNYKIPYLEYLEQQNWHQAAFLYPCFELWNRF